MQNRQARDGAKHTVLVGAQTRTTDVESAAFSTADFLVNEIEYDIGVGGETFDDSNKIELELSKAPSLAGVYAAYTGDVLLHDVAAGTTVTVTADANGMIKAFVAAHATAKRYVVTLLEAGFYKTKFEYTGTHNTGTPIAANLRQSEGRNAPAI